MRCTQNSYFTSRFSTLYIVLRSAHIDKNSREQFEATYKDIYFTLFYFIFNALYIGSNLRYFSKERFSKCHLCMIHFQTKLVKFPASEVNFELFQRCVYLTSLCVYFLFNLATLLFGVNISFLKMIVFNGVINI